MSAVPLPVAVTRTFVGPLAGADSIEAPPGAAAG
jgi:hypothetical protein